jgi:hypothetical protein
MLYLTISALSQETPVAYNPFVPVNLDDLDNMSEIPVVEGSYHYYTIVGDPNYTDLSTFVWYVENGTMGVYDAASDTWTPATVTTSIGNGASIDLLGITDATTTNYSGIWVRWNDETAGNYGYIAAYERSSNNCIVDQQISGWRHLILVPPEVWLLADAREECADQQYSVTARFNQLNTISFPYTLSYSYPLDDGTIVSLDTIFEASALDADNQLYFDVMVFELDNTVDEVYTFTLDEFRDTYGSYGKIAPLGSTNDQYSEMEITTLHLPQTGVMIMN